MGFVVRMLFSEYRVCEEKACEEIVHIIKETLHGQGIPILPSFLPSSRPLSRVKEILRPVDLP